MYSDICVVSFNRQSHQNGPQGVFQIARFFGGELIWMCIEYILIEHLEEEQISQLAIQLVPSGHATTLSTCR